MYRTIFILTIIILSLLLLIGNATTLLAQETLIVGQVYNKADQSGIANASLYFENTSAGTITNEEGYFLIRYAGTENTLVVSCVGFKTRKIRIVAGQMAGIQIALTEQNTLLQEVFVVPGANPALPLLDKVREAKYKYYNTMQGAKFDTQTESLILLNKLNQKHLSKKIYDQLATGNLSGNDSTLVIPLHAVTESHSHIVPKSILTSKKWKGNNSLPQNLFATLLNDSEVNLNIYDNTLLVYNRPFVSPLANNANSFYKFYLSDSIDNDSSKTYRINFRPKNPKQLCFNGHLWIDAQDFSIKSLEADMSNQANINFIKRLQLLQHFDNKNDMGYTAHSKMLTANMYYDALVDSVNKKPEIFIHRKMLYDYSKSQLKRADSLSFAGSKYAPDSIDKRMNDMAKTPLLRTALYIANTLTTGYMPLGFVDIGKVQNIARISNLEGFRLTLPLRTNEKLFPNISFMGHVGYGFANHKTKYSAGAQYRLPMAKRTIVGLKYMDDYRRIDYDYHDIVLRESPLLSGDEHIAITIFAFRKATQMNQRKELNFWIKHDWNANFETTLLASQHQLMAHDVFLSLNTPAGAQHPSLSYRSLSLNTRLSKDENHIDDFLDRVYLYNTQPVFYSTTEVGQYLFDNAYNSFARLKLSLKHQLRFDHFQWDYLLETGAVLGAVPYPLLKTPAGSETEGFKRYQFNLMNYREYAADKYVAMHNEISLNGFLMNEIPLIKRLNLRELLTAKLFYGGLSNKHQNIYSHPRDAFAAIGKPYVEVGAGVSNFLGLFTAQFVWRLTDRNRPNVDKWGIKTGIKVSF